MVFFLGGNRMIIKKLREIEPSPLAFLKNFIQAQLAGARDDRRGIA